MMLVAEERNTFGEWLEKQMEIKKISQVDLARTIDKSREQVRRLLRGESGTKRETVVDIAHAIGEKPADVLRVWYDLTGDDELTSTVYNRSKASQGDVLRESSLTYEPMTEDEKEEIISSFEGKPRIARQVAKSALDAILSQYPDVETDRTTHGKKAE